MDALQNFIHRLEVGGGIRYLRVILSALCLVVVVVGYDWRAYRNLSTPEAMDSAQLARNIAQGKGYSTLFIRPLSIYLLQRCNQHKLGVAELGKAPDYAQLKGLHPDLANPPVYPVVLAGVMKALPFRYPVDMTHSFWSMPGRTPGVRFFWRYQPDFLIAMFNQALFLAVVGLTFLLARRVFDDQVAWLSALLLLGAEVLWRFSVSGLSTMLLLLVFMLLIWCLVALDEEVQTPRWGLAGVLVLAALAGLLVALGALTRYAFGWLLLPVVLYVGFIAGRQRIIVGLVAFIAFAAVLSPWVVRNYSVSGTPFGTAGYALLEDTGSLFQDHRLERSLEPDLDRPLQTIISVCSQKLVANTRQIVQSDLPRLGGSWLSAFFLVGLLVGFNHPTVRRLRYFALACLLVLIVVQALGRTQLSEDSRDINSENLLVLVVPLVVLYGVSLFYFLLEQMHLPMRELRYLVIGLFVGITCLPMLLAVVQPKTVPVAYPPYYPPSIQSAVGWTKADELTMSDIPWAIAWYGQSQSVWLTLNPQPDFFTINDYQKPVAALFLSRITMDSRFATDWWGQDKESTWGKFVLECIYRKGQGGRGPPPEFPLQYWQNGFPNEFLLTSRQHWPKP